MSDMHTAAWPKAYEAGASLSYDGTQLCHLETVHPLLERLGIKATFYADPETLVLNMKEWKVVADVGHEIGNGCLTQAALPDGSLPRWTPEMVADEIGETDRLLDENFGQHRRSFAYPWGVPRCGGGHDYRELIEAEERFARSGIEGYNAPSSCELSYLGTILCDDLDGKEMIDIAEEGFAHHKWVIFAFDGVGSGGRSVDAASHLMFCEWLSRQQSRVWIEPVSTICERISLGRSGRLHLV